MHGLVMMYFSILRVGNFHRKKPNGVLSSMIMTVFFFSGNGSPALYTSSYRILHIDSRNTAENSLVLIRTKPINDT